MRATPLDKAVPPESRVATTSKTLTVLEVLAAYAGILYYIWRWQFTRPQVWILILALILASQIVRGDSRRALGITLSNIRLTAQAILPLAAAAYLSLTVYGLARHTLVLVIPGKPALKYFLGYGSWCVAQQYLMQSYFHNRLMSVVRSPHVSSVLVALMFGAAHIPNPILVGATTLGGFVLAEIFAWGRNIWPLVLAQTVGGFVVAALSPPSLIHNMRVGPAYFFYGLQ